MDEDYLPFKALWSLVFRAGLRIHVEPEALHGMWNAVKNAAKRSGLQGALLLGTLMANISHGPFTSGGNLLSKQRAAEHMATSMPDEEFAQLRADMEADRLGEAEETELPQSAEDIPHLRDVRTLGRYAIASDSGYLVAHGLSLQSDQGTATRGRYREKDRQKGTDGGRERERERQRLSSE